MRQALGDVVEVHEAASFEDAIARAYEMAQPAGVVLLAPACASFDMFRDYAERGRKFKEEVARIGHVSSEQSSVGVAVGDRLLGTQAAPACEAGALARGRLMTADCSHDPNPVGQAMFRANCGSAVGAGWLGRRASRGDMARKLKSDNVLFIATILLVALSVVMVYSASAPVALSRYGQASFFVIKQAMWAALGLPMLWFLMKVDYRTYREPVFIWSCLGLVIFALVAVLFSAPINNARRWFGWRGLACSRRSSPSSRRSFSSRRFSSGGCIASTK